MTFVIGVFVLLGVYFQLRHSQCQCGPEKILEALPLKSVQHEPKTIHYDPDSFLAVASRSNSFKTINPASLRLKLDENIGKRIRKNHKARVNCIIEKKKAVEVIAQKSKTITTPLGNRTTDPRMMHTTGEKMVFFCQSDVRRSHKPMVNEVTEVLSRSRRATIGACICDCFC
ncbi:uncharacterized protein LOC111088236 [Limulus polyphemus]|uniref:Uncharacterized protein LOC111088236 n=1 Tax=Limulus polyphemus TaxID=6850 RepID=A0ABM1TC46_LIMPO|nr:uncharacterized protein LOC111088236 [Limulus polyphemus]